jgi:polyisoprenoid-binding protein YceI
VPRLSARLAAAALVVAAAAPLRAQTPTRPAANTAASGAASAGARAYTVDAAHSEINFTASSRMLDAHGHFQKWEADVRLDAAALERSTVRLTIDAASITTRNERRDGHLKSPDFFDVAKYPTITFTSRSVARTSPTTGVITGDLTMHGVTRPVQVPVTVKFLENGRGRFAGAFSVNREDYGVTYTSRMNPIDNEVAVQFNLTVSEAK